jgi:hypothetical protein
MFYDTRHLRVLETIVSDAVRLGHKDGLRGASLGTPKRCWISYWSAATIRGAASALEPPTTPVD